MSKRLSFYQIKGLQILETCQYTFLLVCSTIVISYIIHKINFFLKTQFKNYLPINKNELSNIEGIIKLITELCFLIVIFHHITKYIKRIPSISSYLYPLYIPYRHFDTIIHFSVLHVLIELHPELNLRLDNIHKMLYSNE